ncbi:hypothetical protein ACLOAV_000662 [Pseudogymnoascus australis]
MAPSRTNAPQPPSSSTTSIKPTRATPPPAPRAPQPTQAQLLAALSPAATSALIRRTLHPTASKDTPLTSLLKPLTGDVDVDFEIYALLAVVLREFVVKWYGGITGDGRFVGEIGELVEGVIREGWGRLGERRRENGGWGGVVVEVGGVVGEVGRGHVDGEFAFYLFASRRGIRTQLTSPPAYCTAHTTRLPPPYAASPRQIYHALHPHPALSPVPDPTDPASIELQSSNDAAYRELLAQRLLHTLLPPAERDNPALTALVGAIFADLVIEKAMERACEPGVIWEGIAKVVEGVAARGKSARRVDKSDDGTTRNGGGRRHFGWCFSSPSSLSLLCALSLLRSRVHRRCHVVEFGCRNRRHRIRFQSLDLWPRRLSTCRFYFPSSSTHPPASQVDESGHTHPPATNASLVPLRIENSGASALPCIRPQATGEAACPVIVLHCSAFVLILGLDTHKRTIPQRTVRLSCVCKSADGAEKSSDAELIFLPPIQNEACQANILVVFQRMGGSLPSFVSSHATISTSALPSFSLFALFLRTLYRTLAIHGRYCTCTRMVVPRRYKACTAPKSNRRRRSYQCQTERMHRHMHGGRGESKFTPTRCPCAIQLYCRCIQALVPHWAAMYLHTLHGYRRRARGGPEASRIHITTSRNLPPSNIVSSSDRTTGTARHPHVHRGSPLKLSPKYPTSRPRVRQPPHSLSYAVPNRYNTGAADTAETVVRRRGTGAGEPSRLVCDRGCVTLPPWLGQTGLSITLGLGVGAGARFGGGIPDRGIRRGEGDNCVTSLRAPRLGSVSGSLSCFTHS